MVILTDEQIKQAMNKDLVQYVLSHGEKLKREGKYFRHMEHNSLVFDTRKNSFHWNSKGISGNPINFLRDYYHMSFEEAVLELTNDKYKERQVYEPRLNSAFHYYLQDNNSTKTVFDYLVKTRKTDAKLVQYCMSKGLIREDKDGRCIFIWEHQGRRVGGDIQGTEYNKNKYGERGTEKKIMANSKVNYGFNIVFSKPERIFFFESPIDLLSFMSLFKGHLKNTKLISMSGLKQETVYHCLNDVMKNEKVIPKEVYFCVDRDAAGKEFLDKFAESKFYDEQTKTIQTTKGNHHIKVKASLPKYGKDWNEELQFFWQKEYTRKKEKSRENQVSLRNIKKEEQELVQAL